MWTGAWESLGGARAARRWGAHGAELRGNPHSERFYELDRELHESMRGNVAAFGRPAMRVQLLQQCFGQARDRSTGSACRASDRRPIQHSARLIDGGTLCTRGEQLSRAD